ncbi:alanine racemase [Alteromonas sp. ASW11-130]|uniref:alanine racemase n=1 Tax=Alteromonas sp. ASW11-130 TaxID=3015775 RepID=UPI00224282D9|nr:alanine racemase [Alteromonas sp. ASW11-130]MCW8090840.1 alanine racemase [Alteromonas sp. ASW11-130]
MSRQTRAIIHADALIHNFEVLAALSPDSNTIAVIKADAYGHGAVNVATILTGRCQCYGVAISEEALLLREAGINEPIVIFEGAHQQQECERAARLNCILVAHNFQQLDWLMDTPKDQRPPVWIKIDSGMHRLGFDPSQVEYIMSEYADLVTAETVLVTHLACAEDISNTFTQQQLDEFAQLQRRYSFKSSIANSSATLGWPASRAAWNRIGIALFGGGPLPQLNDIPPLKPAMTLEASVMSLRTIAPGESVGYGQTWIAQRKSVIATVSIGYADGYPRHCPNGTPTVIRGERAPLVGRVSMDMITVDVTDVPATQLGDKVELWGTQVSIDEVAERAGTISYELMTRISPRVPRIISK